MPRLYARLARRRPTDDPNPASGHGARLAGLPGPEKGHPQDERAKSIAITALRVFLLVHLYEMTCSFAGRLNLERNIRKLQDRLSSTPWPVWSGQAAHVPAHNSNGTPGDRTLKLRG